MELEAGDVCISGRDGTFLVPDLREPIAFHLLIGGIYEPQVTRFLKQQLTAGMTFVDVGASIGVFSVLAAKQVGRRGHVLAIEPSRRWSPYLMRNIQQNGLTNVETSVLALGEKTTEAPFFEAPQKHFGMGSFAPQFNTEPVWVRSTTLDELLITKGIHHVDILKVDVEGFEAAVFRGAHQLLTGANPPVVIFEYCDWAEERSHPKSPGEAQRILMNWGYRLSRVGDFCHRKRGTLVEPLMHGADMLVAQRTP